MKDKLLSKQGWVILVICIISFFINNRVVVPDIMEARNMVTAREMVHDGNWLVPTMNGDLRLEKPPLPTWLTAVAEMISPDNLALQRAMAGLAAILLVVFFYLTAVQVMRIYDGGDLFPHQGICGQVLFLARLYLGRHIYGTVVYE